MVCDSDNVRDNIAFLFHISEPNNASPLNTQAAELWENQGLHKKVLLEKYETQVRGRQDL